MCHSQLSPIEQLRFERGVAHLHKLGPRAMAELLIALTDRVGGRGALNELLIEYQAKLTPTVLNALGADRFPNRTPRAVSGRCVAERSAAR